MKAIKMDDGMEMEGNEKMEDNKIKGILDNASRLNPLNKVNPREKKYSVTRQKKPKNEVDQYVEDMIKGDVKQLSQIHSFFANSVKKNISESEAKFYLDLLNSITYNTRVSVTDLLHGAYFNYYIGGISFNLKSNVFTNDRLFWISKLVVRLKKRDIYPFLKLSNNSVSLQTLAVAQSKGYRKGYVQDYERNFSCIGLESLTPDELKKLQSTEELRKNEIKYFKYNNLEYGRIKFESGCTITFLKNEIDKVVDKIKKVRVLGNRKTLDDGIKPYKLKKDKSVYISQNLNLTDFFPCEVITSDPLNYAFLFKFDVDMLAYENHLHENFSFTPDEGFDSFFQFYGLVQWNTFDLMINFLIVEKMTTYKTDDKYAGFRTYVEDFISRYNDIKRDIRDLRKIIEKCLRLLIRFFDSFPTKIRFAKITKFSVPVRDAYEKLKTEIRKGTPQKFEFLLRDYNLINTCITIYNCVKNNCSFLENILKKLDIFLTKFRGKQGGTIAEDAKKIGRSIFNMFNFYNNEHFLVDVIRTPSIFLGNLLEDDEEFNEEVAKENKKMDKKYDEHRKKNQEIIKILDMNKKECIKRFITAYFYTNDIISDDDFTIEDKKTQLKNDFGRWYKKEIADGKGYPDGEYYKQISGYGAELLLDNSNDTDDLENINKETKEKLGFLKTSYETYKQKNNLENNIAINENKEMINILKKENDELKQNKKNYLEEGDPVTEEFMKDHDIEIIEEEEDNQDYNNFVKYARERGISDDVIRDKVINAGEIDWKDIWEKKNEKLIKLLQKETLDRHGKKDESEDDEEMQEEEEINTNVEDKKEEKKEVNSDEESRTYKTGKGSKKVDTTTASYKLKQKRNQQKKKRKNQKETAKNVVGMEDKGGKGGKEKEGKGKSKK